MYFNSYAKQHDTHAEGKTKDRKPKFKKNQYWRQVKIDNL